MGISQLGGITGLRLIGVTGAATLTTFGTTGITPGDSNAYGSWVQVTSSAPSDLIVVLAGADIIQSTSTLDCRRVGLQIGVGAGGSESALATSVIGLPYASSAAGGSHGGTFLFPVPPSIASGSRISIRGRRDTATSSMSWTIEVLYVPLSALA